MLLKSRSGRARRVTAALVAIATVAAALGGMSVGTLDAQDSDTAAERSAREIQAARDRANAAAQAMFDAESRIDQLAVEIESTNTELAALEAEVAAFRVRSRGDGGPQVRELGCRSEPAAHRRRGGERRRRG